MRGIDSVLLAHVLRRVASRACPSTVPRSGREGAEINCFNTTVLKNGEPDLVLLQVIGDEVRGLRYDGNRYSVEARLPFSQIDPNSLHVTHFYGLDRVDYEGTWAVARGLWTGWPYAWLHAIRMRNGFAQVVFNRRSLPTRRRLDLLREVFTLAASTTEEIDALSLMSARHGDRWAGHPTWQSHHGQLEDQLELLADAGDLRKWGTGYRPTGEGLKTLEDGEEADRRHKESFRLQAVLAVLAAASVVMAAAQANIVRLPLLLDFTPKTASSPALVPAPSQPPSSALQAGPSQAPVALHTPATRLPQAPASPSGPTGR